MTSQVPNPASLPRTIGDLAIPGRTTPDRQPPVQAGRGGPDGSVFICSFDGVPQLLDAAGLQQRLTGWVGSTGTPTTDAPLRSLAPRPAMVLDASTNLDEAARLVAEVLVREPVEGVAVRFPDGRMGIAPTGPIIDHLLRDRHATTATQRSGLEQLATHAMKINSDPNRIVGLFVVGLDWFDQTGEASASQGRELVLDQIRARLVQATAGPATVLRVDNDEFAVLIEDCHTHCPAKASSGPPNAQLAAIGDRLHDAVCGVYRVGGSTVSIEPCTGGAVLSGQGAEGAAFAAVLARASTAMTTARHHRMAVTVWQPDMATAAMSAQQTVAELCHAIPGGQLRLHYQPIVDATNNKIIGVEALARWQHPVRGLLPPAAFLPLAERSDVILAFTDWTLNQAVRQAYAWRRAGRPIRVSVNLATPALGHDRVISTIDRLLERFHLPPDQLVIEVGERTITAPDEAVRRLATLRARGVNVALDNFGTGSASFAILRRLPLNELKLDRSLTARLNDPAGKVIIASMVEVADRMNLRLVGEGIEEIRTASALRAMGFDMLQGYHYGRPQPPEAITIALPMQESESVTTG